MEKSPDEENLIISEISFNISEKVPKTIQMISTPMNSNGTQKLPLRGIVEEEGDSYLSQYRRNSLSNTPRGKKQFANTKKSQHYYNPPEKKESIESNVKNVLARTRRISKSVNQMVSSFKQRKMYREIDNMCDFHFKIIGDPCFYPHQKDEIVSSKDLFKKITKNFKKRLNSSIITYMTSFMQKNKEKTQTFFKFLANRVPTINANNPIKILWDFILLTMTAACLFAYSIEKAFVTDIQQRFLSEILMFILYVDIGVNLNTKFYLEGVQIDSRERIFRHYIKIQGIKDVIPIISLSLVNYSQTSALFDLNLCLLLTLSRLYDFGERLKELIIKSDRIESLYNLLILLLKIFIWAHSLACLWHYFGYLSHAEDSSHRNWIKEKGISNEIWETKYLFSIYWSVTTMLTVGYGDIIPTNSYEMVFNILAMILGCGVFGYTMNSIGEILKDSGKKEKLIKEQMKKVTSLLKDKSLPMETQTKVKKYLEFVWTQEQREDTEYEQMVMNKLSSRLRDDIVFNTHVKFLKNVPVFKMFSDETLISLASHMKKIRISPEEHLIKRGDCDELSLYLVIDGKLELVTEMDSQKKRTISWKTFQKGDYIGTQEIFTGTEHSLSVIAAEFSTLFQLSRKDVLSVLKRKPEEYEKYCRIRDLDLLYSHYSHYEIKCNSCGYNNHSVDRCKFFSYQPLKLKVIANHIYRKKGKKFERKNRPDFNSLMKKKTCVKGLNEFQIIYNDDEEFDKLSKIYYNDGLGSPSSIQGEFSPSFEEGSPKMDTISSDGVMAGASNNLLSTEDVPKIVRPPSMTYIYLKSQKKKNLMMNVEMASEVPKLDKISLPQIKDGRAAKKSFFFNPSRKEAITDKSNLDVFQEKDKANGVKFWFSFDKMRSFKFYFAWNNIESIVLKFNQIRLENTAKLKKNDFSQYA